MKMADAADDGRQFDAVNDKNTNVAMKMLVC